jgi:hypothetical protein
VGLIGEADVGRDAREIAVALTQASQGLSRAELAPVVCDRKAGDATE